MNTPYQLVSMATILRDYLAPEDQDYRDDEHEKLSDIADSLYAAVVTPDQFTDEYKSLYEKYGTEYWDKVLEDMSAIDSQLTSDIKVEELYADYEDRLKSSMSIHSAKKIKASDNPFYDKLSAKDKRFANQVKEDVGVITLKGKVGKYDTYLTIDMWYGDKFEPMKYGADASFYGNDGEYHGNIYNDAGEIIGDYTSDDSTLISKNFQIDWGD